MSVNEEPSGRRSIRVEVEVVGDPEQVWRAIATGPGITAWFAPATVDGGVGGTVAYDFGDGMVSTAQITEWQPPRRFVAEDHTWLQGGPPIATEWTVDARGDGTCVVRVVQSLFANTDEWDQQLGSAEQGWPRCFRVLGHYLAQHAGEAATTLIAMAKSWRPVLTSWRRLLDAFGVDDVRVGQKLRLAPQGLAAMVGTVTSIDELVEGRGITLALDEPVPGVLLVSAMDCMGMPMASLHGYYYGPGATAALGDRRDWQRWLEETFPPPVDSPPFA